MYLGGSSQHLVGGPDGACLLLQEVLHPAEEGQAGG